MNGSCLSVVVFFLKGTERFSTDIENMIGHRPNMYYRLCWKYISPLIIGVSITLYPELPPSPGKGVSCFNLVRCCENGCRF